MNRHVGKRQMFHVTDCRVIRTRRMVFLLQGICSSWRPSWWSGTCSPWQITWSSVWPSRISWSPVSLCLSELYMRYVTCSVISYEEAERIITVCSHLAARLRDERSVQPYKVFGGGITRGCINPCDIRARRAGAFHIFAPLSMLTAVTPRRDIRLGNIEISQFSRVRKIAVKLYIRANQSPRIYAILLFLI